MKNSFCAAMVAVCVLFTGSVSAQEKTNAPKNKKRRSVTISNHGIRIEETDSSKTKIGKLDTASQESKSRFTTSIGPCDIGINILADNTNYADPSVRSYLHVPAAQQNKSLFDLRQGKSINVNVYPIMVSYKAVNTHGQRIYISTGIGLQLYNFRFESPLTFTKNPAGVMLDTISFKKDKLGLDYINVPLMLTFKTRISGKNWLVYGFGITEGYLVAAWNKQVSGARGQVKVHDKFGLADFNTCVSAEIGWQDGFRFYATYQLTSLYNNGIDLHPFSFGLRFSGI